MNQMAVSQLKPKPKKKSRSLLHITTLIKNTLSSQGVFFIPELHFIKLPYMTLNKIVLGLVLLLSLQSCIKDRITIDENTVIPGLTPSLAIPIADAHLTLQEADNLADSDELAYNVNTGYYEYVLNRELFNYPAGKLLEIQEQDLTDSYPIDDASITGLNNGVVGDVFGLPSIAFDLNLNLSHGEVMDSIIIQEGQMALSVSSTIKHNFLFFLSIPSLKKNNIAFADTFNLNYPGSSPFNHDINLDLNGYTLDLTNGTIDNNVKVVTQIFVTNTGETVISGDELTTNMLLDISAFESAWGYFGQYTQIIDIDSNDVNIFNDLNGGTLYLSEPRIELFMKNTAGLDFDVEFESIVIPNNGSQIVIGGSQLTDIPTIEGASIPGEMTTTIHQIDNSGTSPSLSVALGTDPDFFIYTASGTTNPNGVSDNFLLDSSYVKCDAKIILPAFGYADNFTITDTVDADIEDLINEASSQGDVITYEDVEALTIRLVIQNGLPVRAGVKAYFVDSNHVVIDSVFMQNDYQFILEPGYVDFSLATNDPNYGRVQSPTESVTDISFTGVQIQNLIDNHVTKMIIRAIGLTSEADQQQEIKFYPDDEVGIKVSAKVDFNLDLTD